MDREQQYKNWLRERDQPDRSEDKMTRELDRLWEESARYGQSFEPNVDAGWERLRDRMQSKKRIRLVALRRFAAAAALVVAAGLAYLVYNNQHLDAPRAYSVVTTAPGEQQLVTLPDGSTALLNERSRLEYPANFEENRRAIRFSGEAFFEIAHAPDRPFSISTEEIEVVVKGTSFNLRAYPEEDFTETEVTTGLVEFRALTTEEALPLEANQCGIYHHGSQRMERRTNTLLNRQAWHTHQLEFRNTTLPEVSEMLERYYTIRIDLKAGNDTCPLTGLLKRETLDDFSAVQAYLKDQLGVSLSMVDRNAYRLEGVCR